MIKTYINLMNATDQNLGFPSDSDGKETASNVGDPGSVPGLGRSRGGRAQQPTPGFLLGESPWTEEPGGLVHGVAKSQT